MVSVEPGSIPGPRTGVTMGVTCECREVCGVAHTDKTDPWRVKEARIRRCAEGVAIDKDFSRWNGGGRRLVGKRVRRVTRAALRGMRGDVGAWDAYTDARLSDYRRDWDFYAAF